MINKKTKIQVLRNRVSQGNLMSSFNFENRQVLMTQPVLHRVVAVTVPDGSYVGNCNPKDTVLT